MILSIWTDRSGQTVQTQIRPSSDQGVHCLTFCQHILCALLYGKTTLFKCWVNTASFRYRNDLKFLDGQVLANTADPDQTAPRGVEQSDQGLHCLQFRLHLLDA